MKILVITGYCLKVNSSANLCHLSYIKGLLDNGITVDLITRSDKNQNIDNGIKMPNVRNIIEYDGSMYDRIGGIKKQFDGKSSSVGAHSNTSNKKPSLAKRFIKSIKRIIRNSYGVYRTDIVWFKKAKKFFSDEKYDYVITLAHPPISHKLAEYLIRKNRIKADKWIQIWEDPWYADLGFKHTESEKREEGRLLKQGELIYYVSPITLEYQKEMFPESSEKMRWMPLPSYYEQTVPTNNDKPCFGYFGDYELYIRNLVPFYDAAVKEKINVYICGNSKRAFASTDTVKVYPRMPLQELEKYENQTNVLVFLCNLRGGQIPGKIYQYSATDKKILFILDGTEDEKKIIREYFEQFKRYVFCENNVESITEAIELIRSGNLSDSYSTPLSNFTPSNIINKILEGK